MSAAEIHLALDELFEALDASTALRQRGLHAPAVVTAAAVANLVKQITAVPNLASRKVLSRRLRAVTELSIGVLR